MATTAHGDPGESTHSVRCGAAPPVVSGFSHTGVVVRDLEAMTAFYRDVMGLAVQLEEDVTGQPGAQLTGFPEGHIRVVFMGMPGQNHVLELVEYVNPQGRDEPVSRNARGAWHLCFQVEDMQATYQALLAHRVRFVNPPARLHSEAIGPLKACYALDPEGNSLEFLQIGE